VATPPHPASNHGANGRFVPGNTAGRGNENFKKAAYWHSALLHAIDADMLAALGTKMYAAAMQGDWQAAKLLLAYAIGRPAAVLEVELHNNPPRKLSVLEKLMQVSRGLQAVAEQGEQER
jgi:hypothetical protein